jgi:hypothetical protein
MLPYSAFTLKKAVPNGAPLPVYGVLGDAYLQQLVVRTLLDAAMDADARDFNMDTVDGESATVGEVLSLCGNLPFLSERRAVVVNRAERLENIGRAGESEDEKPTKGKAAKGTLSPAKRLSEGLKNLPPTTLLLLLRTPETPEPGARASTPVASTLRSTKFSTMAKRASLSTARWEQKAARWLRLWSATKQCGAVCS